MAYRKYIPPPDLDTEFSDAAFNMATATLKRLNELLIEYRRISTELPSNGESQLVKYKTVRQVYLAAVPLMRNEDKRKEIKDEIDGIKLETIRKQGQLKIVYSPKIDSTFDDIVEKIILTLQKDGKHFMPDKGEEGLF